MPDVLFPGSAGFGRWRVTDAGEVYYDPQGNGGGWPPGVTNTKGVVLVRDAAGDYGFADLSVDVTAQAANPQVIDVVMNGNDSNVASWTITFPPAQAGDLRVAILASFPTNGLSPSGTPGFQTVILDNSDTMKIVAESQLVTAADSGVSVTWAVAYKPVAAIGYTVRGANLAVGASAVQRTGYGAKSHTPSLAGVAASSLVLLSSFSRKSGNTQVTGVQGQTYPAFSSPSDRFIATQNAGYATAAIGEPAEPPTHPARTVTITNNVSLHIAATVEVTT